MRKGWRRYCLQAFQSILSNIFEHRQKIIYWLASQLQASIYSSIMCMSRWNIFSHFVFCWSAETAVLEVKSISSFTSRRFIELLPSGHQFSAMRQKIILPVPRQTNAKWTTFLKWNFGKQSAKNARGRSDEKLHASRV